MFALSGLVVVVGLSTTVSARIHNHHKLVNVENAVEDSYIVLFQDGKTTNSLRGRPLFDESFVQFQYDAILNGVALKGVTDDAMMEILESEDVKMVYEDAVVQLDPEESRFGKNYNQQDSQTGPVWGLDRIDSSYGLDGVYNYDYTGAGVTIFIADSGVLPWHSEFSNRYRGCMDFTGEGCGVSGDHGTHVAGTAMGTTYGVAKGANVFDVKVLGSSGSGAWSWTIAGFNYVAAMKRDNPNAKYVLNASLGGSYYEPVNQAAAALVATGVVVVLSAGNGGIDACTRSPGSTASAITVGSSMITDSRSIHPGWWASNWGTCVDIFAPGSDVLSASNTGGTTTKWGTSMASPHVAGIAAILLEQDLDPYTELINIATSDVLADVGSGSPNLLACNGFSGDTSTPPPTPAPTDLSCSDDEVVFTLELTTDFYGVETSWELINDCTGATVVSGGNYMNGAVASYSENYCVMDAQQYTFTINDSYGDGLCCDDGEGSYIIHYDGSEVGSGGVFDYNQSHMFGQVSSVCSDNRSWVRDCSWDSNVQQYSCNERNDDGSTCGDDWIRGDWQCKGCGNPLGDHTKCCRCTFNCNQCHEGECSNQRCLYRSCSAQQDDGYYYCQEKREGSPTVADRTCDYRIGTWQCANCASKSDNKSCCKNCTQIGLGV